MADIPDQPPASDEEATELLRPRTGASDDPNWDWEADLRSQAAKLDATPDQPAQWTDWHPHGTDDDTLVRWYSIEEGPLAEIVCHGDVNRDDVLAALLDAAQVNALTTALGNAQEYLEAIAQPDELLDANEDAFSPMAARRMQEQAKAALDLLSRPAETDTPQEAPSNTTPDRRWPDPDEPWWDCMCGRLPGKHLRSHHEPVTASPDQPAQWTVDAHAQLWFGQWLFEDGELWASEALSAIAEDALVADVRAARTVPTLTAQLAEAAELEAVRLVCHDLHKEAQAQVVALTAERDELLIAINGGCGCPAPYTECPHDEPLLPALNQARAEAAALRARAESLEADAELDAEGHRRICAPIEAERDAADRAVLWLGAKVRTDSAWPPGIAAAYSSAAKRRDDVDALTRAKETDDGE